MAYVAKLKYHPGATFTPREEKYGTPDRKRSKMLFESAGIVLPNEDRLLAYLESLTPAALAYVESVQVYTCDKPYFDYMPEVQEHTTQGYGMRLAESYRVRGNKVEV